MKAGKAVTSIIAVLLAGSGSARAALSPSAYRVLGQPDLRQDGANGVQGTELSAPGAVALALSGGQWRVYIADSQNHRILAWADAASYQNGDRPALVLGQPGFTSANPMGLSYKGLNTPSGLAVDPASGDLYVADTGNSRVLRFADPFNNLSRVEPVAVLGQPTFQTLGPNNSSSTVGKSGLKTPQSLAFDAGGNLWVSDTGNHRVLRFPFASLNADKPAADLVLGQADYASALPNRGAAAAANTLYAPAGLAFDAQGALYIADFNNARVVKYTAPAADAAASGVFGQSNLTTRGVPAQPTDSSMAGPAGLAVSADGLLYVAVPLNHRILVFDAGASAAAAKSVLGQLALSSADPDAGVFPLASESVLFGASDVKVDAAGNLLVADTGNNRVLYFPHAGKAATSVWGQADFHANGVNQVKARGINTPYKMAIDYSRAPFTLYVSDTNNNRVLVWRDAARFRSGDEADLAIGQPNLQLSAPNVDVYGKPSKTSLYAPRGIAVDTAGNLFVADSGNHRILRYPRPADQSGRITPDMVLGQADFTSAELSVVNGAGFHTPTGIVLAPNGNLLVSDTGNNRVLEFAPGAQAKTPAIRVYGQPDFTTAAAPAAPTAQNLLLPQGLFMDIAFNLYVADSGFNRVLIFSNTQKAAAAAPAASTVLGQDKFTLAVAASGANRLHGPVDVALDSTGNLYVSDLLNHRVLIYDPIAVLHSASATGVIGQNSLAGSSPNWDALNGFASARGMFRPEGLLLDRQDTLYVADSGNNRVAHYLKTMDVTDVVGIAQTTAPGAIVSAYGGKFADTLETAAASPLPFSLAGREVVVEDAMTAALYYVSPGQVNLQVPAAAPAGTLRIALRRADTGELIAGGSLAVARTSPALFATLLNENNSLNSASAPAVKGGTIQIFGVGQGEVSPAVADGAPASGSPLSSTVAQATTDGAACVSNPSAMCVVIGNSFAEVLFSGLTPGLVGVWQINARVPANAPSGAVPVRVVINGTRSNGISVNIK